MRLELALGLVGFAAGGCVWEHLEDRPVRVQFGINSRRISTPAPTPSAPQVSGIARTTGPTPPTEVPDLSTSGSTGSLQFTMNQGHFLYLGGEVEAGPMQGEGSFLSGLYGVVGAQTAGRLGTLSVEAVAGRQWLRGDPGAQDIPNTVIEPRVRGQFWLSPQLTLGGVVGASGASEERGWMAGIYIGVFSTEHAGPK